MSAIRPSSTSGSGLVREKRSIDSRALCWKLLVRLLAARDADQLEALRQRPLVGEVVERGQQLAVGEVAGRAEDHQRRRMDRQALEPLDQRVLVSFDRRGAVGGAELSSALP